MIANELSNEQGHIESAPGLLVDLMPDGSVISEDGGTFELGDKYDFNDRVSEQECPSCQAYRYRQTCPDNC